MLFHFIICGYDKENPNRLYYRVRFITSHRLEVCEGDEKLVEAYVNGYRVTSKTIL